MTSVLSLRRGTDKSIVVGVGKSGSGTSKNDSKKIFPIGYIRSTHRRFSTLGKVSWAFVESKSLERLGNHNFFVNYEEIKGRKGSMASSSNGMFSFGNLVEMGKWEKM